MKTKEKEILLKAEKQHISCKGAIIQMIMDFWRENMEAERNAAVMSITIIILLYWYSLFKSE